MRPSSDARPTDPSTPGGGPRSSLLALVEALEPVVGVHRSGLDPSDAGGVPPHVTVLHPFLPVDEIDGALATLTGVLARHAPFDVTFAEIAWFDDGLLTLAPEPADAFRALTADVHAAFPAHVPYEGRFAPVPHLTVGYAATPLVERRRAAVQIEGLLPVRARVEALTLMADAPDGRWARVLELPLGSSGSQPQGSDDRWRQ